jgi:hypothetical protein
MIESRDGHDGERAVAQPDEYEDKLSKRDFDEASGSSEQSCAPRGARPPPLCLQAFEGMVSVESLVSGDTMTSQAPAGAPLGSPRGVRR